MADDQLNKPNIVVRDDREASRFVIEVDGQHAGLAAYRLRDDRTVFVHTEISDEYSGQGLGSILAREALDSVRAEGRTIVPLCPFIAGWIERHPEYKDSVDLEALEKSRQNRS